MSLILVNILLRVFYFHEGGYVLLICPVPVICLSAKLLQIINDIIVYFRMTAFFEKEIFKKN